MSPLVLRTTLCGALSALILTRCSTLPAADLLLTPWDTRMVDVGGYRLFLQCSGDGSPAVILESGGGADSAAWLQVMRGIDATTRVCAHDRVNEASRYRGETMKPISVASESNRVSRITVATR